MERGAYMQFQHSGSGTLSKFQLFNFVLVREAQGRRGLACWLHFIYLSTFSFFHTTTITKSPTNTSPPVLRFHIATSTSGCVLHTTFVQVGRHTLNIDMVYFLLSLSSTPRTGRTHISKHITGAHKYWECGTCEDEAECPNSNFRSRTVRRRLLTDVSRSLGACPKSINEHEDFPVLNLNEIPGGYTFHHDKNLSFAVLSCLLDRLGSDRAGRPEIPVRSSPCIICLLLSTFIHQTHLQYKKITDRISSSSSSSSFYLISIFLSLLISSGLPYRLEKCIYSPSPPRTSRFYTGFIQERGCLILCLVTVTYIYSSFLQFHVFPNHVGMRSGIFSKSLLAALQDCSHFRQVLLHIRTPRTLEEEVQYVINRAVQVQFTSISISIMTIGLDCLPCGNFFFLLKSVHLPASVFFLPLFNQINFSFPNHFTHLMRLKQISWKMSQVQITTYIYALIYRLDLLSNE